MIFFENKLLLQPDVDFDSESNGRYFSSLAKQNIFNFFQHNDVTSRRVSFSQFFGSNESLKKVLQLNFLILGHMTSRCSRN